MITKNTFLVFLFLNKKKGAFLPICCCLFMTARAVIQELVAIHFRIGTKVHGFVSKQQCLGFLQGIQSVDTDAKITDLVVARTTIQQTESVVPTLECTMQCGSRCNAPLLLSDVMMLLNWHDTVSNVEWSTRWAETKDIV